MDQEMSGTRQPAGSFSFVSTANGTPVRSGTPNTDRNPFGDERIEVQASQHAGAPNPFASPSISRPPSSFGSSSAIVPRGQRYFHSRRVKKGEVEKPWLAKSDPKEKWVTILPIIGILVGLGISGFLVWDGIRSVVQHKYCLVLEDNFDSFNADVWTKEVQVGGFGYVFEVTQHPTGKYG
jgi:hypothetical protein